MSKFFFSNEEIKEMPEPFKLPDISFIPGYRELKEEYDNLRYCIAIGRNQIYIDETFQNHYLDERMKKVCEQFTQPNISVFPGNREEEEEDDGTVQSQIVAHNLPRFIGSPERFCGNPLGESSFEYDDVGPEFFTASVRALDTYLINTTGKGPSEYDVKKANQIGCINLITDVFNDLLKKKRRKRTV